MALVLDASVGASTANTFVTAAEMTTYCEGRLNATAWSATAAQEPALVEATRELSMLRWKGSTASETQSLAWPRLYVQNPDSSAGNDFDSGVIPQRVKDATCDLALQFLRAGTTDISIMPSTEGVIEKTVDVLTTRYASPREQKTGLRRFPSVYRFISPMLAGSGGFTTPLERS